jgi:O-antigen ligase
MKESLPQINDFYAFKIGAMWAYCKSQHFSFWMICSYLFVEFVRPQSIIPALNFLPWAMIFILFSAIGACLDKSVTWVSAPANKWMVLLSITIIISVAAAFYPEISKKRFMDFFNWVIIYFLIITIINTKERFYVFLCVFLISGAKIAVGTAKVWVFRGFSFTSWGLSGPPGFFQNSGELAILMLILFPLFFYLSQALKPRVPKWEFYILTILWVCPILTILGASSRGAQIALVLELFIIFRKSFFRIKPLLFVLILSIGLFKLMPEEQKQRFSESGDDKTSQQRLLYWEHGLDMIYDYPLTGVGFFNFIPYYENYFSHDMLYEHAELPHNIFIQVGTDVGVIGLACFCMLIFVAIRESVKIARNDVMDPAWRAIAAGFGAGVFGFVVAGQFVTVTYYPFLWINLSFIMAARNILAKNPDHKFIKNPS